MMSFRLAGRVFRLAGREFPKIALILVPGHLQCSSLLQTCFLYEEQQEAKRPKSPAKEDVQQAEQHGSGGECGEEMETDMREILYPEVGFGFGSSSTGPYVYSGLGSAPAPTALEIRAPPACHCAPALW